MFFRSSSPLRTEAENWFLSELRGRYDVLLKYVARHPGVAHANIEAHVRQLSPETSGQVDGYLRVLVEKYRMIERRNPIFAPPRARRGRYYLRDDFLRSWLGALRRAVASVNFRPESALVDRADDGLRNLEGHALERLVGQLYEERSRRGIGDSRLTRRIDGYWDRGDMRPYRDWTVELAAIAPRIDAPIRRELTRAGVVPQDLDDLTADL